MRIIIEVDEKTAETPHVETLAPSSAVVGAVERDESAGAAPTPVVATPVDTWNAESTAVPAVTTAMVNQTAIDAGAAPGSEPLAEDETYGATATGVGHETSAGEAPRLP
jgi:hypothetical protein